MLNLSQYSAGSGLLVSYSFYIAFVGMILFNIVIGGVSTSIRHWAFVIANLLFLFCFTGIGTGHLIALVLTLSVIYAVGKRLISRPRNAVNIFHLVLGVIILFWSTGKIASAMRGSTLSWLFFIGMSYLLVKVWTFLKDVHDGYIKDISLPAFLNYCTFFPTFISGPMHYYGEFVKAFEERASLEMPDIIHQVYRILYGMVKVQVIAVALRPYSLGIIRTSSLGDTSIAGLFLRSFVYSFVLYMDFSGYCDIAIGSSGLLGISVPENFRLPYLARNIRDFWQQWHVTFTRFLTQYIYIPFTRSSIKWFGPIQNVKLSVVAYLITFAFVGFWHGSTLNFLLWGIYHGIGLSLYDMYKRRFPSRAAFKQGEIFAPLRVLSQSAALLLTFSFVSIGWILFVLPVKFFL